MSNEFLKLEQLQLNPAGYLTNGTKPVTHKEFVEAQKAAEYVVKLADAIKNKNFECGKVDNLAAIKAEVQAAINATSKKVYVTAPTKPVSAVNEELVQFALDFAKFEDEKGKIAKINEFMQQFSVINDVESVGEYFSEGLVKLSKLYTTEEILEAVKVHIEKLK